MFVQQKLDVEDRQQEKEADELRCKGDKNKRLPRHVPQNDSPIMSLVQSQIKDIQETFHKMVA